MRSLLEMRKINTNTPKSIIVHHTGGTNRNPLADTSHHTFESIQSWHINGRGWDNIGYHWVIEKDGKIKQGRPENYHGAHARGHNKTSVGIVMTGNFDATLPTDAQVKSLRKLLIEVMERHNITSDKIVPHRKHANKTCYGKNLSDDWARKLVEEKAPKIKQEVCSIENISDDLLIKELVNRLKK